MCSDERLQAIHAGTETWPAIQALALILIRMAVRGHVPHVVRTTRSFPTVQECLYVEAPLLTVPLTLSSYVYSLRNHP